VQQIGNNWKVYNKSTTDQSNGVLSLLAACNLLGPDSITSIYCGFVVQEVVQ